MPTHLKILVSICALLASAGMFWFDPITDGAARWVALALGPFAVFAIWVFPEAKGGEIRKEAARRRAQ
ncbi:MAG: hypothetical protein GKR94_31965 [Gammaproteobacteria bacterium]|nr:hypothetical protein [Gammaproteobacteria bacterium]